MDFNCAFRLAPSPPCMWSASASWAVVSSLPCCPMSPASWARCCRVFLSAASTAASARPSPVCPRANAPSDVGRGA
eukprot:3267018-Rhodomonas_salina.1